MCDQQLSKCFLKETTTEVRREFYWWATALRQAFQYANVPITSQLYRGYNKLLQLPSFRPMCSQPTSTSSEFAVAQSFAGANGMVIVSNADEDVFGMDISFLSRYDNEAEVWYVSAHLVIVSIDTMQSTGFTIKYSRSLGLYNNCNLVLYHPH